MMPHSINKSEKESMNFNQSQLEAINHFRGPCLVLAGAGSGKTRVLTKRIETLINQHQISPENILAVTFTNKASEEMKERLAQTVPNSQKVLASTFHAFGAKVLRENSSFFNLKKNFSIYSEAEKIALIKRAMHDLNKPEDLFAPKLVLWKISSYKSLGINPDQIAVVDPLTSVAREIYGYYQKLLLSNNAVDFDDLLIKTLAIFKTDKEVLAKYQNKYKFILVDEFQDTNLIQYQIIKLLAEKYRNLFVVGDDDQSIYGFRGANFENIINFDNDWEDCKTIILNINYRSTPTILEAASKVIANNTQRKAKKVNAFSKKEKLIEHFHLIDEKEEAQKVAEIIKDSKQDYGKFAILLRTNHQTRSFEEALREENIPYEVVGGMKFYDRKEIKDLLAYLNVIVNPDDEVSFLRIINTPRRGIGEDTIFKVSDYAKKNSLNFFSALKNYKEIKKLSQNIHYNIEQFLNFLEKFLYLRDLKQDLATHISRYIRETGYEEMLEKNANEQLKEIKKRNIEEFISSIERYERTTNAPSLEKFLEKVTLLSDKDEEVENTQNVKIMTVHSSKGLEFDNVIISCLEEGNFPHEKSIENGDIEEERRLFYVALTRAKQKLYLTTAAMRTQFRDSVNMEQSRFLKEIPENLFETNDIYPDGDIKENALKSIDQLLAKIKNKYKSERI